MAAGSIVVDLLMRTGSFETDTARAAKSLKRLQKEADDLKRAFKASFAGNLLADFAQQIGTRLAQLPGEILRSLDAFNDLSDATGESVENLSALEDVALRTGTSMDTASDALIKLNKALEEARKDKDSTAAQAIRNLGLEITELAKLSPVERLQAVGRALNGFGGENRLAYNMALLGKGVRETAPLLKDLGEAGALNATVTKRQAEEAEKFNKEIFALSKNATDAGRALLGPLIGALNATAEAYRRAREEGVGFLEFALRRIGKDNRPGSGAEEEDRASRASALRGELQRMDALLERGVMMEQKRNDLIERRAQTQKQLNAILVNQAVAGAGDIPQDPRLRDGARSLKPLEDTPKKGPKTKPPKFTGTTYEEQIAEKAASLLEDSDVTRARVFADTLAKLDDLYFNAGISGDLYDSAVKKLLNTTDSAAEAQRAYQAQVEEGRQIFEKTRTPAEQLAATQTRLNDLLAAGAVSWDTYARAVFQAQDAYDAAVKGAEQASTALDDFAKNAAENIQRSFGDTLQAAMEGNWKSIGDGFKSMLNRMVAEALAANIARQLFGGDSKGGVSGTGGLLGDLLKQFGAEILGFAGGGDPPTNRVSLVGERGPELFVPRTAGTIVPAGATAAALRVGGVQVTNNFTLAGPVDRRTEHQLALEAWRGVRRATERS
jgi:hypothetical protein